LDAFAGQRGDQLGDLAERLLELLDVVGQFAEVAGQAVAHRMQRIGQTVLGLLVMRIECLMEMTALVLAMLLEVGGVFIRVMQGVVGHVLEAAVGLIDFVFSMLGVLRQVVELFVV